MFKFVHWYKRLFHNKLAEVKKMSNDLTNTLQQQQTAKTTIFIQNYYVY